MRVLLPLIVSILLVVSSAATTKGQQLRAAGWQKHRSLQNYCESGFNLLDTEGDGTLTYEGVEKALMDYGATEAEVKEVLAGSGPGDSVTLAEVCGTKNSKAAAAVSKAKEDGGGDTLTYEEVEQALRDHGVGEAQIEEFLNDLPPTSDNNGFKKTKTSSSSMKHDLEVFLQNDVSDFADQISNITDIADQISSIADAVSDGADTVSSVSEEIYTCEGFHCPIAYISAAVAIAVIMCVAITCCIIKKVACAIVVVGVVVLILGVGGVLAGGMIE